MVEQLTIRTPENVRLQYGIAGLGSRFFALCVDTLIQNILLVAFTTPYHQFKLESLAKIPERIDGLSGLYLSLIAIFLFLISFGYFIFFELFWNGQTPGKKIFGLKVRRLQGHPLDFFGALLRNILRVVDMLPFLYLAGLITAFFHPSGRRIGDIVAGTIVIRESRRKLPTPLRLSPEPDEDERRRQLGGVLPLHIEGKMQAIREFLRRRGKFPPSARERLARTLLNNIFPGIEERKNLVSGEAEIYLGVIHRWYEQERLERIPELGQQ